LTAFRQFRSARIDNQPVVPIARLGQAKQRLQEPVDRGRGQEVAPAHDVGYALQRVVDGDRQMVARREIAAPQDRVAPEPWRRPALRGSRALAIFHPRERSRRGVERMGHVEAQRRLVAAGETVARLTRGERAAGSGVERRAIRIAAGGGARDLRAAAKTGVDEATAVEAGERRRVVAAMLALPARRLGKAKPKPGEVVDNRRLEARLAAGAIQVLDAQKDEPAGLGGQALVHERGIGVAEMKRSVRRRREPENRRRRGNVSGHGGEAEP